MAFQPVPNCAKTAIVHEYLGTDLINILHFTYPGSWGQAALTLLVTALYDAWVANIMPNLSGFVSLVRVEGRGLRAPVDVAAEFVPTVPATGGRGGDAMPSSIAFAMTHLTGLTGRTTRGRTFFGGFSEEDCSGDVLTTTRADALRNGLSAVRDAALAVGWEMVVVSRFENKVLRAVAQTIPVIGFRWRDRIVDSQRRRLTKRGS